MKIYSSYKYALNELESEKEDLEEMLKQCHRITDFCFNEDLDHPYAIINSEANRLICQIELLDNRIKDLKDQAARETDAEVNHGVND